jgi:hypothetical protein
MPRYFFDFKDGRGSVADEEGSELTDLAEAKREAVGTLLGMASDGFPNGQLGELSLTVRDDTGTRFTARLLLEITP